MYALKKFYASDFNPQQYWDDRYASDLSIVRHKEDFKEQDIWLVLEAYLEKNKRYLDARCGIGGYTMFLNDEGYMVDGIDTYARTVRALTDYNPDLKVKVASVTQIPFADNSFDGVLAVGALEYLENEVPVALAELARVTKSGGWVLIEVPLLNTMRSLFYVPLKKLEAMLKKSQPATFANYLFTRAELFAMLEEAGFSVVEEQPHELPQADSHYGLYVNFPFLRGSEPYKLNILGKLVKAICNSMSPWIASTGVIVVAKKN